MAHYAVTERDARGKRCCGPEGCGQPIATNNRREERYCITSKCMAWSWYDHSPAQLGDKARGFCALINYEIRDDGNPVTPRRAEPGNLMER